MKINEKNIIPEFSFDKNINQYKTDVINIKFVSNSYELLKIMNKSEKIFPEGYNFLSRNKAY